MINVGLGIYLLRLTCYLYARRAGKMHVCGKKFNSVDDMEVHRRNVHPDAVITS
jgi:hypothetical protein